jgi:hypothetical protein
VEWRLSGGRSQAKEQTAGSGGRKRQDRQVTPESFIA